MAKKQNSMSYAQISAARDEMHKQRTSLTPKIEAFEKAIAEARALGVPDIEAEKLLAQYRAYLTELEERLPLLDAALEPLRVLEAQKGKLRPNRRFSH